MFSKFHRRCFVSPFTRQEERQVGGANGTFLSRVSDETELRIVWPSYFPSVHGSHGDVGGGGTDLLHRKDSRYI